MVLWNLFRSTLFINVVINYNIQQYILMKTVFIQVDNNNLPVNYNFQKAIDGFRILGYNISTFDKLSSKFALVGQKSPVIGTIDTMRELFQLLEVNVPKIDYNVKLKRNIYETTVKEFRSSFNAIPKFVKPIENKIFDGCIISTYTDLKYLDSANDCKIYVSDVMNIDSEWRFFVYYDKIVGFSHQKGNLKLLPSFAKVEQLMLEFKKRPIAYTVDVCVTPSGETDLVEFNDFYAIDSYGLEADLYAQMLKDRYLQILKNN